MTPLEEKILEQWIIFRNRNHFVAFDSAINLCLQVEIERLTTYDGSLALMPFEEWQTLSAETRARLNVYGLKMETLQKERQWIPVSERLPEEGMYTVLDESKVPITANYDAKSNIWQLYIPELALFFQPILKTVTHWQPLPERPQEQS